MLRTLSSGSRKSRKCRGSRAANSRLRTPGHFEPLEDRRLLAITLDLLGTYATGVFDESAAEIVVHDPETQRLFVTNPFVDVDEMTEGQGGVDVLDVSDPTNPTLLFTIDTSAFGLEPTSVAVRDGTLAVATRNEVGGPRGSTALLDTDGNLLGMVEVGFGPDMLAYTPDGSKLLVANQGRPSDDYMVDPIGTVSIIAIPENPADLDQSDVVDVTFEAFNGMEDDLRAEGVRIFGPKLNGEGEVIGTASAAEDLEPENIAISSDSATAWVTLQENNAIAVLDIGTAAFTEINAIGFKDHLQEGYGLDPSDRDGLLSDLNRDGVVDFADFQMLQDGFGTDYDFSDFQQMQVNFGEENFGAGAIKIANHPVFGMYHPDGIEVYEVGGQRYLVTANEGTGRDEDGFNEVARVADLRLSDGLLAQYPDLQNKAVLGRLRVTTAPPSGKEIVQEPVLDDEGNPVLDDEGNPVVEEVAVYSELYAFGGRSFAIWTEGGQLVFESGDDFEQVAAARFPDNFNTTSDKNKFDDRSDDKGSEPETVVLAEIDSRQYAFISLERISGIMIYDVTDPQNPVFQDYVNNRDFSGDPEAGTAGDLGTEGMVFIRAEDSPTGIALLVAANEVSGTTTVYEIAQQAAAVAAAAQTSEVPPAQRVTAAAADQDEGRMRRARGRAANQADASGDQQQVRRNHLRQNHLQRTARGARAARIARRLRSGAAQEQDWQSRADDFWSSDRGTDLVSARVSAV